MSHVLNRDVTLTVAGGGGAASGAAMSAHRRLDTIRYTKPGSGGYTGTPLITISDTITGEVYVDGVDISTGSRSLRVRKPTHDKDGVANSGDFAAPAVPGGLTLALTGAGSDGEYGTFTFIYGGSK